ncbi:MAG TPA: hypothetical protein VE092_11765 [Herbaspirillum sp.]|uniref:hypothetical protein n=1 Tax=Herbaspirillum sp. TaxID=1890675 RepID=UPI002D2A14D3|nr:hypothetical protein [Herbaspirillum sp.]HZG20685.1 hypothetical protein [Herbaspirillum sp.]
MEINRKPASSRTPTFIFLSIFIPEVNKRHRRHPASGALPFGLAILGTTPIDSLELCLFSRKPDDDLHPAPTLARANLRGRI